jgi:hypothetical protein
MISFFVVTWLTCVLVLIGYLLVDGDVSDRYLNDLDLYIPPYF